MIMIVLIHVLIAVSSLIYTAYVYLSPSEAKVRASYGLVGLTLASGTFLVLSKPAHMLQACIIGLFYLGIIVLATVAAREKLATAKNKID